MDMNYEETIIIDNKIAGIIETHERGWTAIVNGDHFPCASWEQAETVIHEIHEEAEKKGME